MNTVNFIPANIDKYLPAHYNGHADPRWEYAVSLLPEIYYLYITMPLTKWNMG